MLLIADYVLLKHLNCSQQIDDGLSVESVGLAVKSVVTHRLLKSLKEDLVPEFLNVSDFLSTLAC
jgi:hypothetical protein